MCEHRITNHAYCDFSFELTGNVKSIEECACECAAVPCKTEPKENAEATLRQTNGKPFRRGPKLDVKDASDSSCKLVVLSTC